MNVALSAVITWSKLNNYPNPFVVHPMLDLLRQGLRRTFLRRTKPQPLAITADIVLQLFLRYWRLHGDDPTADIGSLWHTRAVGTVPVSDAPRRKSDCTVPPPADANACRLPSLRSPLPTPTDSRRRFRPPVVAPPTGTRVYARLETSEPLRTFRTS